MAGVVMSRHAKTKVQFRDWSPLQEMNEEEIRQFYQNAKDRRDNILQFDPVVHGICTQEEYNRGLENVLLDIMRAQEEASARLGINLEDDGSPQSEEDQQAA